MVNELITALCLNLNNSPNSSKYYTSCVSSMQAVSIQTKIKPEIDDFEQRFNKRMVEYTGEKIWWAVGFGYTFLKSKELNLNTKINTTHIQFIGNTDLVKVGFTWYL